LRAEGQGLLDRFSDPAVLVAVLNDPRSKIPLDEKDVILAVLVRAGGRPPTAKLATELLLLGLWPGLSNVFGRLAGLYEDRPNDLAAEIVARFATCARRLDLRRCKRVAATLVLNTERVIRSSRLVELRRDSALCEFHNHDRELSDPTADRATTLVELKAWLRRVVPKDVDLVLAIVIDGRDCCEAAAALGVSHAAARQRLSRAFAKIRRTIAESAVTDDGVPPAFVG
jgi:RNA polymerase sigma-70 factor (ECF subfamily)